MKIQKNLSRFTVRWLDPFTKSVQCDIVTAETRQQAFDIAEGKEKPFSARGNILNVTEVPGRNRKRSSKRS